MSASAVSLTGLTGCFDSDDDDLSYVDGAEFFPQGLASGDPAAQHVLLWTRVVDPNVSGDMRVVVQVAKDENFTQVVVNQTAIAEQDFDGCLKVRVTGLSPYTHYYYRFFYAKGNTRYRSIVGRTKTAPAPDSDTQVKFGFVSCQDMTGRYFNSYLALLNEDLDFILHLGDYVYETTGDPSFQNPNSERAVSFSDEAGAITLGSGDNTYHAAQSLSNYRELYKTYRSDSVLQQIHARFPMICIWDDHEFSDDCWQDNATYFDGQSNEQNQDRRRNAERAYFEFMPIDQTRGTGASPITVSDEQLFPQAKIYRDFNFGKNLHIACADYRSYRPDHLIPEDAFPGTVVMNRDVLTMVLSRVGVSYDDVKSNFSPYIDVEAGPFAGYKAPLTQVVTAAYMQEGLDAAAAQAKAVEVVQGELAVTVVNTFLTQLNAQLPPAQQIPLISDAVAATLDAGLAFFTLGKTSLFSDLGSRYFVLKDTYDLYARYRRAAVDRNGENALGDEQVSWLHHTFSVTNSKWKVFANSVSFTPMVLDLRNPALGIPAPFNQRFYLNADQWDGFPTEKQRMLNDVLGRYDNVVTLAGDIHAAFATDHGNDVFSFTTSSVSSATFGQLIEGVLTTDPLLSTLPNRDALLAMLNDFLVAGSVPDGDTTPQNRFVDTTNHGVAVVTVDSDNFDVSYKQIAPADALTSHYSNTSFVTDSVTERNFRIANGQLAEV
nr:alkaline phosphatase D family protein [Pleionea sp. CnH1-48]